MQIRGVIFAVATTILGSKAATIPRQNTITNAHLANFRTWGAPGCSADNQGEYNFQLFDLNVCFQFPVDIDAKSIMVENIATGEDIVCNGELLRPQKSLVPQGTIRGQDRLLNYNG